MGKSSCLGGVLLAEMCYLSFPCWLYGESINLSLLEQLCLFVSFRELIRANGKTNTLQHVLQSGSFCQNKDHQTGAERWFGFLLPIVRLVGVKLMPVTVEEGSI